MPSSPVLFEISAPTDITTNQTDVPRPRFRQESPVSPALALLLHAEQRARQVGHENLGFLSLKRGFLPSSDPKQSLPSEYRAWDQVAAELPSLYASLQVRRRIDQLPLLDASKRSLDDGDVLRATGLLAILAHAYWYCQPTNVSCLPEAVSVPWAQLRARLGRRQEAITYIDLIVYNWKRKDPTGPLAVENLSLLFPTIGNQEEQVFYLTQLEILARCTDVLRTLLKAQSAVLEDSVQNLESSLLTLSHQLEDIIRTSLPKISPHQASPTHVDAVTWAKTVAPFAVPLHQGDLGPSGTSSPIFNALDIFLGRKQYASFLGKEIQQLRTVYPPMWRAFMLALSRVNVADYVAASKSSSLREAYRMASDAYAGDAGFLGRHRMKVYGFLELAFKVGRAVTIGGFGGAFKDRTWDQVDSELTRSRVERPSAPIEPLPRATVSRVPGSWGSDSTLHRLRFTVEGAKRVQFRAGDHVRILPTQSAELVSRTLTALGATGNEAVALSAEWAVALTERGLSEKPATLATLLPVSVLTRLTAPAARALLGLQNNSWLRLTAESGRLGDLCLWQVISTLRADGYPCAKILESPDVLGVLLSPEAPRTYSIASPSPVGGLGSNWFDLAVRLQSHNDVEGVGSSFLCKAPERGSLVPFAIQRAASFGVASEADVPLIAFAAGSGIAPVLGILAERLRGPSSKNWLVLSLPRTEDFQFSSDWHEAVCNGNLRLDVVFTRHGFRLTHSRTDGFSFAPGTHRHVQDLLREPHLTRELARWVEGDGNTAPANVYICGAGTFATTSLRCLEDVMSPPSAGSPIHTNAPGRAAIVELVGQRRLTIEAHSDAVSPSDERLFTPADVAVHNCKAEGYWMTIDDVVYDLTAFRQLHPGGTRIIDAYAGMDASHGFKRAHQSRGDIVAQLATYRKGRLYAPVFEPRLTTVDSPKGPMQVDHAGLYRAYVSALNLCVEMENALRIDVSLGSQSVHPGAISAGTSGYVWSRQAETHHRFLATYVAVLAAETLPTLEALSKALFESSDASETVGSTRGPSTPPKAEADPNLTQAAAIVAKVSETPLEALGPVYQAVQAALNLDTELLRSLKAHLRSAVNALAYREHSMIAQSSHPLLALNTAMRELVTNYALDIAAALQGLQ